MFGKEKKSESVENAEVIENKKAELKPEAAEKKSVVEGAKKEAEVRKEKGPDHCHVLMKADYKLNLLEVNHRTIEEIEKARFSIMAKYDGDEAVAKFKDFVFSKLLNK